MIMEIPKLYDILLFASAYQYNILPLGACNMLPLALIVQYNAKTIVLILVHEYITGTLCARVLH